MTKPKFCKDCKWMKKHLLPGITYRCSHYLLMSFTDIKVRYLVTGKKKVEFFDLSFCRLNRKFKSSACGPEGKYWEEK